MDKELTMKIMFGICLVIFLTFFIIEMKNMNIKYIVYNFVDALKVEKSGRYKNSYPRIFYYFVLPFFFGGAIEFIFKPRITSEFISTISTILTLLIGFLTSSLFTINGLIEKVGEKENKKEALIILYNSIVYEIFCSFILFAIYISLYFVQFRIIKFLSFSLCLHVVFVFIFLFYTITELMKLDI